MDCELPNHIDTSTTDQGRRSKGSSEKTREKREELTAVTCIHCVPLSSLGIRKVTSLVGDSDSAQRTFLMAGTTAMKMC